MGCDIHVMMEIRPGAPEIYQSALDTWFGFAENLWFRRDYPLFMLIADVRNNEEVAPVCKPKGFPKDASWESRDNYLMHIIEEGTDSEYKHTCTLEKAEDWVKRSLSYWFDEKRTAVNHPDWHSASWMYLDELLVVEERLSNEFQSVHHGLSASIRAMEVFDPEHKGYARLVFYFDN